MAGVSGQEVSTSYFLKEGKPSNKIAGSHYYRNLYLDNTINATQIYRLEEYYTFDNSPKTLGFVTKDTEPLNFVGDLKRFYPNRNLESLEQYNLRGNLVDTAFYFYPNANLHMLTYRDSNPGNGSQSIQYIGYLDSLKNTLLMDGNGFIRLDLANGLIANDILSYEEGNMVGHKKQDKWTGINGKYSFEEYYKDGVLINGNSYWPDGTVVAYSENTTVINPEYPGGIEALRRFVQQYFKYPEEAKQNQLRGTLQIKFFIDELGKIRNIDVERDLGYGTKEAAVNMMKEMGRWKPGTNRGIPQKVKYTLPINLNLW